MDLDYEDPSYDITRSSSAGRRTPFVRELLAGGTRLHYGAEESAGGRLVVDAAPVGRRCLLAGDSLGTLNAARLKGIHLGMKSGMLAAETALAALVAGDASAKVLARHEAALRESWVGRELWRFRNFHAGRRARAHAVGHGAGRAADAHRGAAGAIRCRPSPAHAHAARRGGPAPARAREADGVLTFDKLTNVLPLGHDAPPGGPAQPSCWCTPTRSTAREVPRGVRQSLPALLPGRGPTRWSRTPCAERTASSLRVNFSNCVHVQDLRHHGPYQVIEWVTPAQGRSRRTCSSEAGRAGALPGRPATASSTAITISSRSSARRRTAGLSDGELRAVHLGVRARRSEIEPGHAVGVAAGCIAAQTRRSRGDSRSSRTVPEGAPGIASTTRRSRRPVAGFSGSTSAT